MKRAFILFAAVILTAATLPRAKSQSYIPMIDSISNVWHMNINIVPVRMQESQKKAIAPLCPNPLNFGFASTVYTTFDTTINNLSYKTVMEELYGVPGNCLAGYIREDTTMRQVYFIDNQFSPEVVLYDFSMQPGDSININFTYNGYFSSGYFHLDSITNLNTISGTKRMFWLNHPSALNSMQWIEGVGHPGNVLYPISLNGWGGFFNFFCSPPQSGGVNRDFSEILSCFIHGNDKVYFDSCSHALALLHLGDPYFAYVDSCIYFNVGGAIDEINSAVSIQIFPNPTSSFTTLKINAINHTSGKYSIIDYAGRIVYQSEKMDFDQGASSIELKGVFLAAGVYTILLYTDTGMATARLQQLKGP